MYLGIAGDPMEKKWKKKVRRRIQEERNIQRKAKWIKKAGGGSK